MEHETNQIKRSLMYLRICFNDLPVFGLGKEEVDLLGAAAVAFDRNSLVSRFGPFRKNYLTRTRRPIVRTRSRNDLGTRDEPVSVGPASEARSRSW